MGRFSELTTGQQSNDKTIDLSDFGLDSKNDTNLEKQSKDLVLKVGNIKKLITSFGTDVELRNQANQMQKLYQSVANYKGNDREGPFFEEALAKLDLKIKEMVGIIGKKVIDLDGLMGKKSKKTDIEPVINTVKKNAFKLKKPKIEVISPEEIASLELEAVIDRLDLYDKYISLLPGDSVKKQMFLSYIIDFSTAIKSSPILLSQKSIQLSILKLGKEIKNIAKGEEISFTNSIIVEYTREREGIEEGIQNDLNESKKNIGSNIEKAGGNDVLSSVFGGLLGNGIFDDARNNIQNVADMNNVADIINEGNNITIDDGGISSLRMIDENDIELILNGSNESKKMLSILQGVLKLNSRGEVIERIKNDFGIDSETNVSKQLEDTFAELKNQLTQNQSAYTQSFNGNDIYVFTLNGKTLYANSIEKRAKMITGNMLFISGLLKEPVGTTDTQLDTVEKIKDIYVFINSFGLVDGEGMLGSTLIGAGVLVNIITLAREPTIATLNKTWLTMSKQDRVLFNLYKESIKKDGATALSDENKTLIIGKKKDIFDTLVKREKLIDDLIKEAELNNETAKIKSLQKFKEGGLFMKTDKLFQKAFYDFNESLGKGNVRDITGGIIKSVRTKTIFGIYDIVNRYEKTSINDVLKGGRVTYTEYIETIQKALDEKLGFQNLTEGLDSVGLKKEELKVLHDVLEKKYNKIKGKVEKVDEMKAMVTELQSQLGRIRSGVRDIGMELKLGDTISHQVSELIKKLQNDGNELLNFNKYVLELDNEVKMLLGETSGNGLLDRISSLSATLQGKVLSNIQKGITTTPDNRIHNLGNSLEEIIKINGDINDKILNPVIKNALFAELNEKIGGEKIGITNLEERVNQYLEIRSRIQAKPYSGLFDKLAIGGKINWEIVQDTKEHFAIIDKPMKDKTVQTKAGTSKAGKINMQNIVSSSAEEQKIQLQIDFLSAQGVDVKELEKKLKAEISMRESRQGENRQDETKKKQDESQPEKEKPKFDIQEQKTKFENLLKPPTYLSRRSYINTGNGVSVNVKTTTGIVRIKFDFGNQAAENIISKLSKIDDNTTKMEILKMQGIDEVVRSETKPKGRKQMDRMNINIDNKIYIEKIEFIMKSAETNGVQESERNQMRELIEKGNMGELEKVSKRLNFWDTLKSIVSSPSKTR